MQSPYGNKGVAWRVSRLHIGTMMKSCTCTTTCEASFLSPCCFLRGPWERIVYWTCVVASFSPFFFRGRMVHFECFHCTMRWDSMTLEGCGLIFYCTLYHRVSQATLSGLDVRMYASPILAQGCLECGTSGPETIQLSNRHNSGSRFSSTSWHLKALQIQR